MIGRLILDPPGEGAWNMAVDDALLETAAAGGEPTLRYYQWHAPTLSLGYFQSVADRQSHLASRDCSLVRRQTGGGAILHDHELTYSLALPPATARARRSEAWYELVHNALIRALADLGIEAELAGTNAAIAGATMGIAGRQAGLAVVQAGRRMQREPFLCFQRLARYDVVAMGFKVCGSAQRSRRGAVLQHGSLLVSKSAQAPELPGIAEATGTELSTSTLAAIWRPPLASSLEVDFVPSSLTQGERQAAKRLVSEKYGSAAWNRRR
jgi:lipoate-protein ligase A